MVTCQPSLSQNNINLNAQENIEVVLNLPQCSFSSMENMVQNMSAYDESIFNDIYFNPTTLPSVENEYCISSSDSDIDSSDDNKNITDLFDENYILNMLAQWTVNYDVKLNVLSALLKGLKMHKCFQFIPTDARTILKNKNSSVSNEIQIIPPGKYYHFGIKNSLKIFKKCINFNEETLKLVIGIDGLPLSKSSNSSFWPILGYIRHPLSKPFVFMIGLYWGKEKAQDSNMFLRELVNELKELYANDFISTLGKKSVILDAVCCDAPAKSYILKTKGHTGYSLCTKCHDHGVNINNRVCFTDTKCNKRTHLQFLNRIDEDYHVSETVSILTEIPEIDMVDTFPLDYMHLTCLGVVKKLVLLWLGSLKLAPLSVRLPSKKVHDVSNHLSILKSNITTDFCRTPRGLNEVPRWKATEFRQFLLYTGPIVLYGVLSNECYLHFICLHVSSTRILLVKNNSENLLIFVEKLLVYFVQKFADIYGKTFMSHNIHGLLHITEDYKNYGALDSFSCFPFENFMKSLKKMIRKHEKPLEQVVRRYNEKIMFGGEPNINLSSNKTIKFKVPHSDGPLTSDCSAPQFKIVLKNDLK